jgi:glycosyltransferase involved in cell wall biosynthesis
MKREAERTLHSLSASYQTGIEAGEYEVIAIDNGSPNPLSKHDVERHGPNFRYVFYETDSVSPVAAVNAGVDMALAPNIALIVDGARMASPGLIRQTLVGLETVKQPFVCSLSWHLGPKDQNNSMLDGYNQVSEDRLMDIIKWPTEGYKLFDISTLAPSSMPGFNCGIPRECSWFAMCKNAFEEIGGFDQRFQTPGGGLVNHDFRNRAMKITDVMPVAILGEGVFHQYHGGISTNATSSIRASTLKTFNQEYERIHGLEYSCEDTPSVTYVGNIPEQALRFEHTQGN